MTKTQYPLLAIVAWDDAHSRDEQVFDAEVLEHAPLLVETTGWVVKHDAIGITLFSERIDNGDGTVSWRGHTFVPAGMVRSVTPLRLPPKPRKKKTSPPPMEGEVLLPLEPPVN